MIPVEKEKKKFLVEKRKKEKKIPVDNSSRKKEKKKKEFFSEFYSLTIGFKSEWLIFDSKEPIEFEIFSSKKFKLRPPACLTEIFKGLGFRKDSIVKVSFLFKKRSVCVIL